MGVSPIPKQKRIRLSGKALKELNDAIFKRDQYKCVNCGKPVPDDHKFHHEPCGPDKSDEINKGAVLCDDCHDKRHFSVQLKKIKKKVKRHLQQHYGDL